MTKRKFKIGYTAGTFDLFHIGHLNIIKTAKEQCDFLIVAVSTDELVLSYKKHTPVIPFSERVAIVSALKYVDLVVPQYDMNKFDAAKKYNIEAMFVGDDWKNTDKWNNIQEQLKQIGVEVVFLKHTDGISSTLINMRIKGEL